LLVVKNASRLIAKNLNFYVESLKKAAKDDNSNAIRELLEKLVPGYMYRAHNSKEKVVR